MESLDLIKKRRLVLGVTQKELSKLSGVSQSMIAKIEAGRAEASYNIAKRIFEVLDSLAHESEPRAKDFMKRRVVFCNVKDNVSDVIKKMKKSGISQLPVFAGAARGIPSIEGTSKEVPFSSGKELVGLISEGVLVDNMDRLFSVGSVGEIMGEAPPVVNENTSRNTVVSLLKEFPFVMVRGKKGFSGLVTKSDVL